MPRFGPIKRRNLIAALQQLGFTGPYVGGKHQYMKRGEVSVRIPNPHQSDIGSDLLSRILKDAEISRQEWEQV